MNYRARKDSRIIAGIWRQRGRRLLTGANVCVSVLLALALTVMIDYLAYKYHRNWNISWRRYYSLSDRTRGLIASLKTDVDIHVFFQRGNELYEDVRNLLKEYEHEAARTNPGRLWIDLVDPDRDLARVKEFKQKYDLKEENVVLFAAGGRTKYVSSGELADYEFLPVLRKSTFKGEQVFSSAIQSVVIGASPVVYFLVGHGERDPLDYDEHSGYSSIARAARRDNMEVSRLNLSEQRAIPDDCSAIVIAGPQKRLSADEVGVLAAYLDQGGRILLLADPAVLTGLEKVLEDWGVRLGNSVVVGYSYNPARTDLIVMQYGDHPITRNLSKIATQFFMPREVNALFPQQSGEAVDTDKPRVSALASNTKEGWAETDPNQKPPRFDSGIDRPGPTPIALAVEKGQPGDIDVEIKPTRLVVIGDSYFVSNGGLRKAIGGNVDFFLSALNWLASRDALLAIGPKPVDELRLDMTNDQVKTAAAVAACGIPAAAALIGIVVWLGRKS